jgi:hypothetical protein
MARQHYFRQRPGLDTRMVDGEAFIITPSTIRHLNPVASLIWLALEQPLRRAELVELMAEFYPGVPREQLAADVRRALAQLVEMDLATQSKSPC